MEHQLCVSHDEEEDGDLLVDDYFHMSLDIVYSPVNIPGPGADVQEFESQLITGCQCLTGPCASEASCKCIMEYGRSYNEKLKLRDARFDGHIMECNSSCACDRDKCGNRVVQRGPLPTLEVYESGAVKGKGLRARSPIEPGMFVCEYAGEVIGLQETEKRVKERSENSMNYIFHLMEHLADGSIIHTYIDPTYVGNIGRYINHSCDPNCTIVPVRVDSPAPRLAIFSSAHIAAGEEITFDYGSDVGAHNSGSVRKKACLCGQINCRRFLPSDNVL